MINTVVRTVMHSTGERIPLLFQLDPYQPMLVLLTWVTLERRYKACSSIDKDVRALKSFYDYCWETGYDLELAILDRDFDSILSHYGRFAFWIKSRRKTNMLTGQIGSVNPYSFDEFLGAATVNSLTGKPLV
jgi:hypothetical protein